MFRPVLLIGFVAAFAKGEILSAAEIVLPQNRQAYYSGEPIEIAVAGLAKDQTAVVELAHPTSPVRRL